MKPDWKDAPEWAQWLAQDYDGEWVWHEERPKLTEGCWFSLGRSRGAGYDGRPPPPLEPRP
jgi:hypothetical protein